MLRLLLFHPEVELVAAYSPVHAGRPLADVHTGLYGECHHTFTDILTLDDLDLLVIAKVPEEALWNRRVPETVKVISLVGKEAVKAALPDEDFDFVPALSEMFRKPLVRGARAAYLFTSPVALSLIVLYPLALHLLLNDTLKIHLNIPANLAGIYDAEEIRTQLGELLGNVQLSLKVINPVEIVPSEALRTMEIKVEMDSTISREEIEKAYNDIYDDHNFTFITERHIRPREVAGTHKCLISVEKPSADRLLVTGIADGLLRGGAGDAVHAMNLLFGLFEKTGLSFPAMYAF